MNAILLIINLKCVSCFWYEQIWKTHLLLLVLQPPLKIQKVQYLYKEGILVSGRNQLQGKQTVLVVLLKQDL